MKQAFGIFTAILLMPAFQVQAWVGGPWSNNSHQANGDDGIYEAIGSMTDGIAMYRWAVQNENPGGATMVNGADGTQGSFIPGTGPTSQIGGVQTSNVQFGGLVGSASPHVLWYRGIVYYGRCFGIVNSGLGGAVAVVGNASADGGRVGTTVNGVVIAFPNAARSKDIANSHFTAKATQRGPLKRFSGAGQVMFVGAGRTDVDQSAPQFLQPGHKVKMKVFGSQVSLQVNG